MSCKSANYPLVQKMIMRRLHDVFGRSRRNAPLSWLTVVILAGMFGASRATAADPIIVPVILSMTGTFSFYGQGQAATLHAIETLVNKRGGIGGRPLQFQVQDDQGLPQVAVEMV